MKKASLIAVLLLCALFSFHSPGRAQNFRIGYTSKVLTYLPLFVGWKKGFYQAEGLRGDVVQMFSGGVHIQALATGELHFGAFNPDSAILFNERGGNLKVIAGVANAAPYLLIGGKKFRRVEDLKGEKLGASALRGGTGSLLTAYLRAKGLVYPRDYAIVVIAGGTPNFLSALESGAIAGAVLGIPFSDMALERGLNSLGDVLEVLPRYQFNAINVDPAWAEKNGATVVRVLKAHIRSLRWIYEHPEEAAQLLTSEIGVKPPYAGRGINYFTRNKVFPPDGSVTLEGLTVNLQVLGRDGLLKEPLPPPEKYVDLSYLKQAQKELGM
jgi:NitT/TauT family transport system substrate-binding protein